MKGVVTFNGVAASGARVIFNANSHWYGKWEKQEIIVGANGEFEVPEWRKIRPFVLVHQPVIEQTLTIKYKAKEYTGWQYTRMSYSDKSDGATGLYLKCELTAPVSKQEIENSRYASGVCVGKKA